MTIASDGVGLRDRTTVFLSLLPSRRKDRRLVLAMGSGPQTTAWLHMFWHAAFALLVIACAFTKDDDTPLAWGLFAGGAAIAGVLGLAERLRETLDKR